MLCKYVGRHKRGLLAINVFGLFLILIFISSLFVRSVQASTQYNILYFHAGNIMNEDPGSAQVSTKISPGSVILTIRPASDVSIEWTPKGGGSNYVEIYETSHDDDTTYVSDSAGKNVDQYGLDDHTTESGSISQVKMYIWCYQTGAESMDIGIVSGATTDVVSITPASTWTEYTNTWTNNPDDSQAWEWADIDALQAYIKSTKVGGWSGTEYVTQIYYEVTYSYASSISWSANYWTDNWWVGVSSSWSVVFYFDASGGELATGTVTVTVGLTGPPGADKTPVSHTGVSCSGDTGSSQTTTHDVSGWADRDATTTWLNDDAANPCRTLTITITITSGGPIAIEYDAVGSPGNSRLNTGTIVPENFLQLIFVAPFIPLVAKAAARWSEKGRRKAGPKGGGRQ